MRAASVGFHCPECVREGAKATRSGRTAYGGARSKNPALTSQVLVAINVAVFLLIQVTGGSQSPWLYRLALLPARGVALIGGAPTVFDGVAEGAVWQLLTSAFTHVDLWHIGFNMVALWVLGPQLEVVLGRTRFLAVYFLSALSGSVCVYWLSGISTPTIGASGAIFGLMAAVLVVARGRGLEQIATQFGLFIVLNLVITFVPGSNISAGAHLGGLAGGALAALLLVGTERRASGSYATAFEVGGLILLGAGAAVGAIVAAGA